MVRLVILLIAILLGFHYSRWMVEVKNPSFIFWNEYMTRKTEEIQSKREQSDALILFTGGSSCSFSVNAQVIEEVLPCHVYNYGGAVNMGIRYILSSAFEHTQSGDTLILALEKRFLIDNKTTDVESLGISLARDERDSDIKEAFSMRVSIASSLMKQRPGTKFLTSYYAKKLIGSPAFKYTMDDFRYGGRLETEYRAESPLQAQGNIDYRGLSENGIDLLEKCRELAKERNVTIYYSLPWAYTKASSLSHNRAINKGMLDDVAKYIQVLPDETMGASSESHYFSDTHLHLTEEGSIERSKMIANALKPLLKKI